MKKVIRIFGVVLVVSLFFSVAPPTQGFMIFDHHESKLGTKVLIHKVHDAQWQIDYRFASRCPAEFRKEGATDSSRDSRTDALRVWLQPLREISAQPIVDDFLFQRQEDYDGVAKVEVPARKDTPHHLPVRGRVFRVLITSMDDSSPKYIMRRSLVVHR